MIDNRCVSIRGEEPIGIIHPVRGGGTIDRVLFYVSRQTSIGVCIRICECFGLYYYYFVSVIVFGFLAARNGTCRICHYTDRGIPLSERPGHGIFYILDSVRGEGRVWIPRRRFFPVFLCCRRRFFGSHDRSDRRVRSLIPRRRYR